jgi:hypothetical protein
MKLKVGDKAKIKKNLGFGVSYGGQTFISDMACFEERSVTIDYVTDGWYAIKEDHNKWCWTDEMFESIEKTCENCKYVKHPSSYEPCCFCTIGNKKMGDHWELKEEIKE